MNRSLGLAGLFLSTALTPGTALAQVAIGDAPSPGPTAPAGPAAASQNGHVEISAPGTELPGIVVIGRNIPQPVRDTSQVVSVLSAEDIARTGDGDIASALTRVTGLSVVGNGYVYVRGLGDRYSLALLNGSPLPSPEPLKRVVPLDIFPSSIIASALVQKSYSVNYPGEFGGGVVNLTTMALPEESFLEIKASISGNAETTGRLGYTYYGSRTDWTGFDDGARDIPFPLRKAIATGRAISLDTLSPDAPFEVRKAELAAITASLANADTTLLQRNDHIPANFSGTASGGFRYEAPGGAQLGLVASAGLSNEWRTRDAIQQVSIDSDLGGLVRDARTVLTDNHVVVHGLLGTGIRFGENSIRWTGLYIRDTLKQGRLSRGTSSVSETRDFIDQNTAWYERQLIDAQASGEFKLGDFGLDLRAGYANTKREAPYERGFDYVYNAVVGDYVNNLNQSGAATISFSKLEEHLHSGAADFSYTLPVARPITLSAGYAYTDQSRTSTRRDFRFTPELGSLGLAVSQERPDYLLSDYNIRTYGIYLREATGVSGAGAFDAGLRVQAGYARINAELFGGVTLDLGFRYEDARQFVTPLGIDGLPAKTYATTELDYDYWLPAATLTWNLAEDMQLRFAASQTIARPQFRELAQQVYQDTESDRQFIGNPFLTDSKLINAEARYEYYFAPGQRFTLAGFYKQIEKPIEAFSYFNNGIVTSFANAPEAGLYGAEIELLKYFPLNGMFADGFLSNRRLVLSANYTYSQSELKVKADDTVRTPLFTGAAAGLFDDGDPLTGQSDHLVNIQIGLEDPDALSQQTLLLRYASDRVTSRGLQAGILHQPPIIESPGLRLDLVLRQGFSAFGALGEFTLEARNLTGTGYEEFQQREDAIVYVNKYDVGTSGSIGVSLRF